MLFFLNLNKVVSLALICSFSKMREHLKLGAVKPEEVSEDTVKAVAETLKASSSLKVSEDGESLLGNLSLKVRLKDFNWCVKYWVCGFQGRKLVGVLNS